MSVRECEFCSKRATEETEAGAACAGHSYMLKPGGHRLAEIVNEAARQRDGVAQMTQWSCEDGWVVEYSTTRVEGGPHDGKFVALLFKPEGKGARTGNARQWRRVYLRAFSTRKGAKARALAMYYKHSPKTALRHGRVSA